MKFIMNIALSLLLTVFAGAALAEGKKTPPTIDVEVNGLVCDFCAQAVTKVFKKQDEVVDIDVNLSSKKISVWLKDGMDISDEKLTKLIVDSGYNVVKINRGS